MLYELAPVRFKLQPVTFMLILPFPRIVRSLQILSGHNWPFGPFEPFTKAIGAVKLGKP